MQGHPVDVPFAPPLWAAAPFAALLLSIALFPLFAPKFWEKRYGWISLVCGLPTLVLYLFYFDRAQALVGVLHEYTSFLALIGSLFVISGGILIHVHRPGSASVNTAILFLGCLLSNLIGTTGASALLIRPYLRINKGRVRPFHVIFFIFLVSNVAGLLTPVGDPPLYLGYLQGVPFFWTVENLWSHWLLAVLPLLAIFYVLDRRAGGVDATPPAGMKAGHRAFELRGAVNFVFLGFVLALVLVQKDIPWPWPQLGMVGLAMVSLAASPKGVYQDNEFHFHPIQEVALLFAGIFVTMVPALEYLQAHAKDSGLHAPSHFFWATGFLSAFLDNAPTYLVFFTIAPQGDSFLGAISTAAVFFGACTYIGNGPNFLVKSIAERSGALCPSFFGYVARFTVPILLPLFALQWWFFFR